MADDRLTLDESRFDFRGLDHATLEEHLDLFNDTLDALRERGLTVRAHPWLWEMVECMDGCLLWQFVYERGRSVVSPDTLRRLMTLLDRCSSWNDHDLGFDRSLDAVEVVPAAGGVGFTLDPALSMWLVLAKSDARAMACLTLAGASRRGWFTVSGQASEHGTCATYLFTRESELMDFWRSLYAQERIAEKRFFMLATLAFPHLLLHPDLSFGKFKGPYQELRDTVVRILGVINDHFARVIAEKKGIPHEVQAALGKFGVDLSPESPGTRGSPKLMSMREVELDGRAYLCEWHAKIRPDRNRIHFSLPVSELDHRIVVGIFTEHLRT